MQHARRWLGALTVAWLLVGCATPPAVRPMAMTYRLVVDNGTATVSGRAIAPSAVSETEGAQGYRLSEAPVGGARVQVFDLQGKPDSQMGLVRTDANGYFTLRNMRIGEGGFLRVSFPGPDGTPRYMHAYLRPDGPTACVDVNLSSSVLAAKIAEDGDMAIAFAPDKLPPALLAISERLPELLGKEPSLLEVLLAATTPQGLPASEEAGALFEDLMKDEKVKTALGQARETTLEVGFVVQAVGTNHAGFAGLSAPEHLLIGQSEVSCELSANDYQAVSFWLNNEKMAEADYADGVWRARVDSRRRTDGPCILSAVGTPRSGDVPTAIAKAFVMVDNSRVEGQGCTGAP